MSNEAARSGESSPFLNSASLLIAHPSLVSLPSLLFLLLVGCGTDPGPGAPYYGNQGNERVLPAEGNGKLPLRARKEMAFYTLKNPRKGARQFGKESLSVDWEVSKTGENQQIFIVVQPLNEPPQTINVSSDFRQDKQGTITLQVAWGFGSRADVPTDVEFYLTMRDMRTYDLQYKVSNSVTLGSAGYTYSRNWTQEEIDRITKGLPSSSGPPAITPSVQVAQAPPPIAPPDLGVDTDWAGNSTGGSPQRLAQKDKPLLGLNFELGNWAGGPCIGKLIPVYAIEPPRGDQKQLIAGPGYVVGGLQVNADQIVRGVRLVLMKLKEDGTLDPEDTYLSDWAGIETEHPKLLGGTGKRMLGVHLRQGLIVDAMAAVMDKPE